MTHRETLLNSKDLELLKNLPNLAEKLNQNMKTVDNIINAQRELNSSLSSVNSSNNGLRGLARSKGKNIKLNLEEAIDIKNIVKQSIEGLNNIFDKEVRSDSNRNTSKNPLASSSNSSLGVLNLNNKDGVGSSANNNLNALGGNGFITSSNNGNLNGKFDNLSVNDKGSCNGNSGFISGKGNYVKGKNTKFEPIEEEINLGNNDFTTNNFLENSGSKPSTSSGNNANQNPNATNPSALKSKKMKQPKDKKEALSTLNNINVLTSRIANNITNIQNNANNGLIANEKNSKFASDDKALINNNLNKSKNFSKQTTNLSSNNNACFSNNYNNNPSFNLNLNNLSNNNYNIYSQNQMQKKSALTSINGAKHQASKLKKTHLNNSTINSITNNSNVTTDAGLTTTNFSNVPNSSRINNRNLKSAKEKTNQNPNNKLNNTNNTINNTNNSNLSTNNNLNNTNNNNFDNINNLNESVSGYFLADGVADQMEIPYLNNPTPTATKKTNQKENNFANKNNYNNNSDTKNLKAKTNLSNNNNNTQNNIVSNSVNLTKLKSKSRVKSSNKRYINLNENESTSHDLSDDFKSVNIKTDANNNSNINKINNSNGTGNKINCYISKNSKLDDSENMFKKLPRDSKSPNIRNYRAKRSINSMSLNESDQLFFGIGSIQDNTPNDLKKIQIATNSSKPENTKESPYTGVYSTENNDKKNFKPKPFLKEVAGSSHNSNAIIGSLSKTPSNIANRAKLASTAKNFQTSNTINTNKNTNLVINLNDFNNEINSRNCKNSTNNMTSVSNDRFPISVQNSAKKREIDLTNEFKDEKNLQRLKSNKKMNSNNLIKSQRNIDYEKEKHKLDSFNKEFLNVQNENLKKLDLNAIQINSINLFENEVNENYKNLKNENILNKGLLIETANIKSKQFFEMIYLFAEIGKLKLKDLQHKKEMDKISKKVFALISKSKNFQDSKDKDLNKTDSYLNSSSVDDETKNEFKRKTGVEFHKSSTMGPNGKGPYLSLAAGAQNERPFELNKTARAVNSLAKARKEKDFLRNSKNTDVNLSTNINSVSNNNNNTISYVENNNYNNNDLYPKYNFNNNLNELHLLRNSYNKPFNKEAEININSYLNTSNNNNVNNNKNLNNNLNSSLIEDLPLENPFNKSKSPDNHFSKTPNCFVIGEAKNATSNRINSVSNRSSKNDLTAAPNLNKIIKIQKFWRKWRIQKLVLNNEFNSAAKGIKDNITNSLGKSEKINSLISTMFKAFDIFESIRSENSKDSEAIDNLMNLSESQIVDNPKMQRYHKEIIANYLMKLK